MRYWWVNQKRTYRQEIGGGYLWSPKRRADQSRNRFYDNMKEVAPGDLVFSYWGSAIRAYGTLRSFGYDAPKPDEFGATGRNWSQIGYRADVEYVRLDHAVVPRAHWLVPPVADERSLIKLGVNPEKPLEVGGFSREQERFFAFHRAEIFRSAADSKRTA